MRLRVRVCNEVSLCRSLHLVALRYAKGHGDDEGGNAVSHGLPRVFPAVHMSQLHAHTCRAGSVVCPQTWAGSIYKPTLKPAASGMGGNHSTAVPLTFPLPSPPKELTAA